MGLDRPYVPAAADGASEDPAACVAAELLDGLKYLASVATVAGVMTKR